MKYIYILLTISIIFGSCNGCNSKDKSLRDSFQSEQDYLLAKEALANNEKVIFEGEIVSDPISNDYSIVFKELSNRFTPSIKAIEADPVSDEIVDYSLKKINNLEEGSFLVLDKINSIIDFYIHNKALKEVETDLSYSNTYTDINEFGFYTRFGKIKPDMILEGNEYRIKLLSNLRTNYKDDYDRLISTDKYGDIGSRSEGEILRDEFLGKTILLHQITYEGDTIPHLKYYLSTDITKTPIPTIFDVSAVCPPVCPK